jgi:hypothetical protein
MTAPPKNAKTMTPDEWRKARAAIGHQHNRDQQTRQEEAALKALETKYSKPKGNAQ